MFGNVELAEVWVVYVGDDDKSPGTPGFVFRDEQAARKYAKGRGWYGGNSPVAKRLAAIKCPFLGAEVDQVFGEGDCVLIDVVKNSLKIDVPPKDELAAKQEILAKLTEEEKKILGLN